MEHGQSIKLINNFFYITFTKNNGAAWSILENKRILLLLITVFVLFVINQYIHKAKLSKIEEFTYGMIIGGIIGNLFDRIVYGSVVDFIDFKLFGYNYPVFNLADSFIVVGIIILMIISIRSEYHARIDSRRK
jgi:signal peptidase II